jgi:predicted nuclease of predicted toxin-antitoxin system
LKFKLDENIGRQAKEVLGTAGHDVMGVLDQKLGGTKDEALYDVCVREGRALVTLDRDFGEVLRFPPGPTAGIIVLDSRPRLTPELVRSRLRDLAVFLQSNDISGTLCIIEAGRVRMHGRQDD